MENIDQQPPSPQPSVQNSSEKPSSKYKILGIINIILGFLQIPVPVGFAFFVIPQLTNLYLSLNIQQPGLIPTYAVLIFLVCLGLINITIGVKLLLKSTQNKEKYFKFGIAAIIIIFLSVGSSMALTITSVLAPIYKLTSELDSSPSPTIFQAPSPIPTINISETSSWKTYTNEEYGFSFKYPNNWIVKAGEYKSTLDLCDAKKIESSSALKTAEKFRACEGSGVTPAVSLKFTEILSIQPSSSSKQPNQPVQLYYYDNPEKLTIPEFNDKYLNYPAAGDPVVIWVPEYKSVLNPNGVNAYYDKEHYCVAMCQVYVFQSKDKIFILKNFPANEPNQLEIFQNIFSTFKFTENYDTSNWITYSKLSKYATFKYPNNWHISEFGEGDNEGVAYITTISSYPTDECGIQDDCKRVDFQISIFNNKSDSLGGFVNKMAVGEEKINEEESSTLRTTTYLRKKDILVNGITALNYIVTIKGKFTPAISTYVTLKYKGNYYFVYSSDENLLNYFIKTIKFTQ